MLYEFAWFRRLHIVKYCQERYIHVHTFYNIYTREYIRVEYTSCVGFLTSGSITKSATTKKNENVIIIAA